MYGVVRMYIVCLVCINLNPTCLVSAGRYNTHLQLLLFIIPPNNFSHTVFNVIGECTYTMSIYVDVCSA